MYVTRIWEANTIDDLRDIIALEGYTNKVILSDDDSLNNMVFLSEAVAFSLAYCICMDTVCMPSKGKEFLYSYAVTGISEYGSDYPLLVKYLDTGISDDEDLVDFFSIFAGDKHHTSDTLYNEVLRPIIDGTDTTTINDKANRLLNHIHDARSKVYHYSGEFNIINDSA